MIFSSVPVKLRFRCTLQHVKMYFLCAMLCFLSSAVSSVWLEALLDSIPALSKDIIRRNVLSLATARSQLSQTVSSRKSGCLIFGAITQKFEPFWYENTSIRLTNFVKPGILLVDTSVSYLLIHVHTYLLSQHTNNLRILYLAFGFYVARVHHTVYVHVCECGFSIVPTFPVHPALRLKREVFPQVRSLCQDVDSEVRVTMCSQLPLFAKHMRYLYINGQCILGGH